MSKRKQNKPGNRRKKTKNTRRRKALSRFLPDPQWPVVRAFVPMWDCWRASGCGTAGVVRQMPEGGYYCALFPITLVDSGLTAILDAEFDALKEFEQRLALAGNEMPPLEEGDIELAARYIWGGYALAKSHGFDLSPDQRALLKSLVPQPPGTQKEWEEQLIGDPEMVDPQLWSVIENMPDVVLPGSQELVVFTEITFDVKNPGLAIDRLDRAEPEFSLVEEGPERIYDWSREYPKDHWSPLRLLGGRQSLGSVRIKGSQLIAEAKTITMVARLVFVLKSLLGDEISYVAGKWIDARSLLRGAEEDEEN